MERHSLPKCVTIDEILEHEVRYNNNVDVEDDNEESEEVLDDNDSGSQYGASALPNTSTQDTRYLKEAIDADRYWEKYLAANDTVVARTFQVNQNLGFLLTKSIIIQLQGLFKNTVVCSVCQYPSVTFEPFMYLPVPLPNAVVRQVEVTLVTARPDVPVRTFLLDLTQGGQHWKHEEKTD